MNCPSCNRQNAEDLSYCDYCGTPLAVQAAAKRKTEFEPVPAQGPLRKRVTEFEPAVEPAAPAPSRRAHDPFDPFGASSAGAVAAPMVAATRAAVPPAESPASASTRKKATEYIPGGHDPFAAPTSGTNSATVGQSAAGPAAGGPAAAVGRRMIGWMITFDDHPDGVSFVLREGRNVVGRDRESDVAVSWDHTVSGTHAYLIWRLGRARVADANTQNGTFLNEEDVLGQIEVKDGDVLRVGRTRFLIRLIDQDKAAALWNVKSTPGRRE